MAAYSTCGNCVKKRSSITCVKFNKGSIQSFDLQSRTFILIKGYDFTYIRLSDLLYDLTEKLTEEFYQ